MSLFKHMGDRLRIGTELTHLISDNFSDFYERYADMIVSTCLDNIEWSSRVTDRFHDGTITQNDLAHDIGGLFNETEHFLPRI